MSIHFNLIFLHMSILFSNFAVEIKPYRITDKRVTMKRIIHDYTKPAEAESLLYSAQRLIANDCIQDAEKRILEAREILQQYLSQDNEIEEDDL